MSEHWYHAYGFTLCANRRLPFLAVGSPQATADVVLELAGANSDVRSPVPEAAWVAIDPQTAVWKAERDEGTYVRMRYFGRTHEADFVIGPGGTHLWGWWSEDVPIEDLSALLLGPVLGCLIRHRGYTCLHASVVSVGGRAIAIAGAKGAGKSTTALALIRQGADFVSDDLAILTREGRAFHVRRGLTQLRLRDDPAASLCGADDQLRPMWSAPEGRPSKQYLDLPEFSAEHARATLPLAGIYILGLRESGGIVPAVATESLSAALPVLMAHRYMSLVLDRAGHARDFSLLKDLVSTVPVRNLSRAEGLDTIDRVAEVILEDVLAPR